MNLADHPKLGILMLETRFPRILGDVGNAQTWDFPVQYSVVKGATPEAIVCSDTAPFVQAFIEVGHDLVAQGCRGIATTCGFLTVMRPRLIAALGVPVATSALEQAGQIRMLLQPDAHIGILTISKPSLTKAHLDAAHVPADTVIEGVEDTGFAASILGNFPHLDVAGARKDLVRAAQRLVSNAPNTGAILLECTNMVPYAPDIERATGVPVFSIYTYLNWFQQGLSPQQFKSD